MRSLFSNPLLSERDGRLFFLSQALDSLSIGVAGVALPWLVLDGGGSGGEAGIVFAVLSLPYVVFGLPAGVVGDRFAPRRVIATCHTLQALAAAVIPIWAIEGKVPILVLALAAFAIGAGRTFADAAAFGAVSQLVGPAAFTQGQAALNTAWATGLLAGPAVGGVLIGLIGAGETMFVQTSAFVVAAAAVVAIRRSFAGAIDPEKAAHPMEQMRDGLRLIFRDPFIRALTLTSMSWNLVSAGSFALLVPLLRQSIHLSATQAGIVLAAGAATGLVSAPVVTYVNHRFGPVAMILGSIGIFSIAIGLLGVSRGFLLALVALCAAQLANWVMLAGFIGERQKRAPASMQARVGITGRMVIVSAITLGSAIASGLTGFVDLRVLYVLMGAASILVLAGWFRPLRAAGRTRSLA